MGVPVISTLGLKPDALQGETVIVTGAGGGIGYEAARGILWLGANVIIAEINENTGKHAVEKLSAEFEADRVSFIQTDVGDETSVQALLEKSVQRFGKVDVVLNNATIATLGKVPDLPIEEWDHSYRVNLRGPVLLAKAFLPGMIQRKHGIFVCVSSKGTAYMGSYETFKTAQVHLADTLDAELEGTGVLAYTIGPGLVFTDTATAAVQQLAPMMGMTMDAFYEMNKSIVITPEEAGAGFAVSLVFADRFKGTETSSMQALKTADINYGSENILQATVSGEPKNRVEAAEMCARVHLTLKDQSEGWKHRSIFERQWVIRDFKKTAGMSAEEWLNTLESLETSLKSNRSYTKPPLANLSAYYEHLAEMAKGYEKDSAKLEANLRYVYGWRDEVTTLDSLLK